MTKEEAIKVLEQIRQWTDYPKEALTMAIEVLSKPSLPPNLDEAAEKYSNIPYNFGDFVQIEYEFGEPIETIVDDKMFVKDAFKDGAEWLAGQGDAIATRLVIDNEGKVNLSFAIGDITDENCKPKYHAGQDVIIQIREK